MTYRDAYQYGVMKLIDAGVEEGKLEARLLLEFCCHTTRHDLLIHGEKQLTMQEEEQYLALIEERSKRIPLQYLTGKQEFMGLEFIVDKNVLIPRQDTEVLVEEVMLDLHDGFHILDMCTGSGCILLSLLRYSNQCYGVGVDISKEALAIARKNAEQLHVEAEFIESNLFEKVEDSFDIIVSNPPYIRTEVISSLTEEVRNHEPHLALDGKDDGLYYYERIIADSRQHLFCGGRLFLEIGYDQGMWVSDKMRQQGYTDVRVVQDLAGLDRVVCGTFTGC